MKVLERVIEKQVQDKVHTDDMQLRFTPRKGTSDAKFIVRLPTLTRKVSEQVARALDGLCGS
jgi:hypothetical protein